MKQKEEKKDGEKEDGKWLCLKMFESSMKCQTEVQEKEIEDEREGERGGKKKLRARFWNELKLDVCILLY